MRRITRLVGFRSVFTTVSCRFVMILIKCDDLDQVASSKMQKGDELDVLVMILITKNRIGSVMGSPKNWMG